MNERVTPHRRSERSGRLRSRGVVMLALLLVLALGSIGLMAALDVWKITRQRDREVQLLFVGDQYRQAIERYYYAAPPAGGRKLPATLADLLDDNRFPTPLHHLRRFYADPITGTSDWGLVQGGSGIAGVYSTSVEEPLKKAGFAKTYEFFADTSCYRDWIFAFYGPRRSGGAMPRDLPASSPMASTGSTSTPCGNRS
ncbi:MAG: type II secretion system protein [Pseudomonadota bacterium]|nr:type II secretion system protein [Pseudomonadota bacterium]